MYTFIVSYEEAILTNMLNGDYIVVTTVEDYWGNELLVLKNK